MSELIKLKRKETEYASLLEFDEVKRWLKELPSATTRYQYLCYLKRYCEYRNMNPTELIREALKRQKSDDPNVRNQTNQELLDFYEYLREHGKSKVSGRKHASKTTLLYYASMRSFYRYNGIELSKFSRRLRVTSNTVEHEKGYIPTAEEINRLINYAPSLRDKAVIATLASSGQRDGVLTALKYKDVKRDLEKSASIIVKVPSELLNKHGINVNKNRTAYMFGISKEASEYIKAMIEERKRDNEPINDDSWLFRSYAKTHQLQGSMKEGTIPVRVRKDEVGEPISTCGIIKVVETIAVKAGLMEPRTQKGERALVHPHSLRKYFKKQASKGVREAREQLLIEFFMGHKVPVLQAAYPAVDFNDPDVVREFYEQIEPSLSWLPKPTSELETQKENILNTIAILYPRANLPAIRQLMACATTIEEAREIAIKTVSRKGELEPLEPLTFTGEEAKEDCQKIVAESELERFLAKGWKVQAVLPSGKIVVEK